MHYIYSIGRNFQNLPKLHHPLPKLHQVTQTASVFRAGIVMQFGLDYCKQEWQILILLPIWREVNFSLMFFFSIFLSKEKMEN